MQFRPQRPLPEALRRAGPPAAIWAAAACAMAWLDRQPDLAHVGNLALLLVLASALSSPWLSFAWALALNLAAVLAFNAAFIEPRGSFVMTDLRQHAWLLATMLAISWSTAGLMARLRSQAELARRHAREAGQLRAFGEALRDTADARSQAQALIRALQALLDAPVQLLMLRDARPATDAPEAAEWLGSEDAAALNADQQTGLWLSLRRSMAFGPGTGRHEELAEWYLPLRGRAGALGAALLMRADRSDAGPSLRGQAQLLCDQMGQALERSAAERAALRARDAAEEQGLRNALLAAISHDYRTPLATIMGAASALQEQDERLSPAQRRKLATTIVDETESLSRMTDNTLQLARLDAPGGVQLKMDWESAEELAGAALRRVRQRHPQARVRARLDPGLPLLRCDAVLLLQLLDNLLDNALKYGGDGGAEIRVTQVAAAGSAAGQLILAVRDRGPGVTPAWRERIFDAFQRGSAAHPTRPDAAERRGAGVGLAACRAIARAHGGQMRYRARSHGGASFECCLPLPSDLSVMEEASPA